MYIHCKEHDVKALVISALWHIIKYMYDPKIKYTLPHIYIFIKLLRKYLRINNIHIILFLYRYAAF